MKLLPWRYLIHMKWFGGSIRIESEQVFANKIVTTRSRFWNCSLRHGILFITTVSHMGLRTPWLFRSHLSRLKNYNTAIGISQISMSRGINACFPTQMSSTLVTMDTQFNTQCYFCIFFVLFYTFFFHYDSTPQQLDLIMIILWITVTLYLSSQNIM